MQDIPPSPSIGVQGRPCRSSKAFLRHLLIAKLSSHDFTYYGDPTAMISGKIKAPIFEIENEKILNRYIFAVALQPFSSHSMRKFMQSNPNRLVE